MLLSQGFCCFHFNNYTIINNYICKVLSYLHTFIEDFNKIPQSILNYFLVKKQLDYIPTVIGKDNSVMVRVMVMDKKATPYPTIKARTTDEVIDLDEIDNYINEKL